MAYSKRKINLIFKDILHKISKEGLSLRKVLLQDGMPSNETFYKWLEGDIEKSKQYVHACEERADAIFDEIIEIADTTIDGIVIETYEDGSVKEKKGDMLGHRRLQIDSRKWALSKMNPKKYGNKVDITTDGESLNYTPIFGAIDEVLKDDTTHNGS